MDPVNVQLTQLISHLRMSDRRSWILMVPNSIGEVATVCGFAKSFVEKHGHGITLVIREVHSYIPAMYPGRFNSVLHTSMDLMRNLSSFGVIPPNHFDVDFPFNTWPAQYGDGRLAQLLELHSHGHGRGGLSFTDLYRHILRLDWDAPIEIARIQRDLKEKAVEIARTNGIVEGKSVILFPGNNTNAPAPYPFWLALVRLYTRKGYKVFTNSAGADFLPGEMPIPGSKQLQLSGDLALAVAELAGNMVIGSNGLVVLSLLARLKCNVVSVITDSICNDRAAGFKPSEPLYSSCFLNIPEVSFGQSNYSEWTVAMDSSVSVLEKLALDIVENRPANNRITSEVIEAHMSYTHSRWADKLVDTGS